MSHLDKEIKPPCILVLTPFLPAEGTHGGASHIFNIWHAAEKIITNTELIILSLHLDWERSFIEKSCGQFRNLEVFEQNEKLSSSRFAMSPAWWRCFASDALVTRLSEICNTYEVKRVFVEMAIMLPYCKYIPSGIPITCTIHEAVSQRFRNELEKISDTHSQEHQIAEQQYHSMLLIEQEYLPRCDHIYCLSPEDAAYLSSTFALPQIRMINLAIAVDNIRDQAQGVLSDSDTICFSGSFFHPPNVDALNYFFNDIWPIILSLRPHTKLRIYGSKISPELHARWQSLPNVIIMGYVDNIYAATKKAAAVIVPVVSGSGARTKLLDAIALERPVVTTPLGAQGIELGHNRNCLIGKNAVEFAESVCRLLDNPELVRRLTQTANSILQQHDARLLAKQLLDEALQEVVTPLTHKKKILDIAVIIPQMTHHGGAERLVIRSIQYLRARGHVITLYTSIYKLDFLVENDCGDVIIKQLSSWSNYDERMNKIPVKWSAEIGKHDIYFSHLFPLHRLQLKPHVCYLHEYFRLNHDTKFDEPFWEENFNESVIDSYINQIPSHYDYKILLSPSTLNYLSTREIETIYQPDMVLTNSLHSMDKIKNSYHFTRVNVLHPGGDCYGAPRWEHPDYWSNKENNRPFRLLLLGALAYHKRWRIAIEAVACLQNIELYIVGQGPEFWHVKNLIKYLKLESRVHLLMQIDDAMIKTLFTKVDAVALCSLEEPFGIAALESALHGLPTLLDHEAGAMDILRDHCVPIDGSVESLTKELARLILIKTHYDTIARSGYHAALPYSWDKFGEQLEKCFYNVIQQIEISPVRLSQTLLTYNVDFFWGAFDKFNGYMPALGLYSMHEGWVVRRHLRQMADDKWHHICLTLGSTNHKRNLGEALLSVQRVMDVAASECPNMQFSLGIRINLSADHELLCGVLRYWSSAGYNNKFQRNGLSQIALFGERTIIVLFLKRALLKESGCLFIVDDPSIKSEFPEFSKRIIWMEKHLVTKNMNVHALQALPVIIDGFNNFMEHSFLEAAKKRNIDLIDSGDFTQWKLQKNIFLGKHPQNKSSPITNILEYIDIDQGWFIGNYSDNALQVKREANIFVSLRQFSLKDDSRGFWLARSSNTPSVTLLNFLLANTLELKLVVNELCYVEAECTLLFAEDQNLPPLHRNCIVLLNPKQSAYQLTLSQGVYSSQCDVPIKSLQIVFHFWNNEAKDIELTLYSISWKCADPTDDISDNGICSSSSFALSA